MGAEAENTPTNTGILHINPTHRMSNPLPFPTLLQNQIRSQRSQIDDYWVTAWSRGHRRRKSHLSNAISFSAPMTPPATTPAERARPPTRRNPSRFTRPNPKIMTVRAGIVWKNGRGLNSTTPSRRSEEHTSELQSRFDLVCRL